ncbi:MAG: MATE family efflux transporter [Anaerostipes sp.]|nr:MATE family efflux transporter [Anaerostipes sp.]
MGEKRDLVNDMSVGSPAKKLFFFAIPMVIGNLFQQLYNVIDSMIVGRYVGEDALAAVGASTAIVFLFVALAIGSSIGYSVVISQFFGAKEMKQMKTAITTSLIASVAFGGILMVFGAVFSGPLLHFMNTPAKIYESANDYLIIYMMSMIFLFLYNTLNGVYNALGASRIPLCFLFCSSVLNIILDLIFVLNFHMGVVGVAWATLISQGVAAVISLIFLYIRIKEMKLGKVERYFDVKLLLQMGRIAVPSMVQQSIVSVGCLLVQGLVNSFGSVVLAGYTAATKIDNITIVPMINVGNAVSTFTAQNIGAKKPERVKKGYHAGMLLVSSIAIVIATILLVKGEFLISLFTNENTSIQVIQVGVSYLRVVSIFYVLMGWMNVTNAVLRGAGDGTVFMVTTLCNFICRVAFAYILADQIGYQGIWWALPIGWFVCLAMGYIRYRSGKWKEKGMI